MVRGLMAVLLVSAALAAASDPAPLPGTLVRVTANNEPVADVFDRLAKLGRVSVDPTAIDASTRVTLTLTDVSFWQVLEQVGPYRLDVRQGGQRIALKPLGAGQRAQPSSISGPFRIVAESVQTKQFQDGSPANYQAELLCHWEPTVRGYLADTQAKLTALTDDQGRALPIPPAAVVQQAVSESAVRVSVPLGAVPRSATALTLTGTLNILGTERVRTFAWDGGKLGVQTQAGMTVDLKEVQREGANWSIVLVWQPGGKQLELESFQSGSVEPEVRLIHASKPAVLGTSIERDEQGRGVRFRYTMPAATVTMLDGWQVEVRAPAEVRNLRVPFVLRAVQLP